MANTLRKLAPNPYFFFHRYNLLISISRNWWISIIVFSRYLEKTKWTDNVKPVYPTSNKVCRGYNNSDKIWFPWKCMHSTQMYLLLSSKPHFAKTLSCLRVTVPIVTIFTQRRTVKTPVPHITSFCAVFPLQ